MQNFVLKLARGHDLLSTPKIPYYEVSDIGPAMSTLMAPRPGNKKVKRFVSGPSTLIRYNSRIPVVVYIPEGAQLRYRVWEAPEDG